MVYIDSKRDHCSPFLMNDNQLVCNFVDTD